MGIGINIVPLLMTAIQYFARLTYKWENRTFCAVTGFDHRLGWIALSSFAPIIITTGAYLQNKKWTLASFARQSVSEDDWSPRLALQIFAAAIILELLIMLTGRITVIQVTLLRLLQGKLQLFVAILSTAAAILMSAWQPLSLRYSRPQSRLHKILPRALLATSFIYAVLVFLLQIFVDVEEYADLALDFVLPWNFRWQLPSPDWTQWWSL